MVPNPSRTEAPALYRRRNPHIWSWFLKIIEDYSLPSLAVELLGLLVERCSLLDDCKSLDVQSLTGLLDCCGQGAEDSLGMCASLLADNLAGTGLLESGCSQSPC